MGILSCYSAQFNCHACVDRQHIVCLHVTAVVSPRHTHKPSFLKGFTVHSGGSETTGHVRMQMIKTEESGSVIRYIKKISTFEKPQSQTGIRYISTAHQKTSSLGGAESDKRAGNTTTQLQLRSLPSDWCL